MNRADPHSWLGRRIDAAVSTTIPACLGKLDSTGRLQNLARAAGRETGEYEGPRYGDSDVWKTIEGAARALALRPNATLRGRVGEIVALAEKAQRPDGYLNSFFTVAEPERRWRDFESGHELYCAGHLIEAGLAWRASTGDEALFDVALRLAEHLDATFGPGLRSDPPGHPEIELALAALHRETGEARWLDLARFFLKARGEHTGRKGYGEYAQDHAPVREQRQAAGHAVRALYLMRGAVEVASFDVDEEMLSVARAFFLDVTERRSYVTGGVGSNAKHEGFTAPFDLPLDGAYCETCASIALFLLARRLLEITHEATYADRMETVLLNALLAGVSVDGDRFFYVNPVSSDGSHRRQTWFECACCPTNVARFLPALADHVVVPFSEGPALALFVPGTFAASGPAGTVRLDVETSYPMQGTVFVTVRPENAGRFTLRLRRPGWLEGNATLRVNGAPVSSRATDGWIAVEREWRDGDELAYGLPLLVRAEEADPRVAATRGRVALHRGPLVFCAEGADHDGTLDAVRVPAGTEFRTTLDADLPGGTVSIRWSTPQGRCRAIPYSLWAHREATPMSVWMKKE